MDTNELLSLIGKDITVTTHTGIDLWLFIEKDTRLCINNNTNAWRFTKGNEILLSSADFFIPTYVAYEDNPFSPVYEHPGYECNEDEEMDFYNDPEKYYEDLEAFSDKRFKALQDQLEGSTISNIQENDIGDVCVTLSNGIVLSVFKTFDDGRKKNYALR